MNKQQLDLAGKTKLWWVLNSSFNSTDRDFIFGFL